MSAETTKNTAGIPQAETGARADRAAEALRLIREDLAGYEGPELRFMEICGTHTASIAKEGIPSLLPRAIRLISGPGCPVCVTVTAFIDRLIELGRDPRNVIVSFGDLLRVRGSQKTLSEVRSEGVRVEMVYSPMDVLAMAKRDPEHTYIFAAVGFETTAPIYALMVKECRDQGASNVRLLTSLKTMPTVVETLLQDPEARIDGFLAPGHVCAVTGPELFAPLAEKYQVPFVVAGFTGPSLLAAIHRLKDMAGKGGVVNLYRSVVHEGGNPEALRLLEEVFEPGDASWRGLGVLPGSGLYLKEEFAAWDAGSRELTEDREPAGCCCAQVLAGKIAPPQCPMFGTKCTPTDPYGACMVSQEGSCHNYAVSGRTM